MLQHSVVTADKLCCGLLLGRGRGPNATLQHSVVTADNLCILGVQAETGFRCSAGISSNRMLAKLVSGLHKPDDQTVLLPPDVLDFVAPLPVRALPGKAHV